MKVPGLSDGEIRMILWPLICLNNSDDGRRHVSHSSWARQKSLQPDIILCQYRWC